jgi:hypothetical protein
MLKTIKFKDLDELMEFAEDKAEVIHLQTFKSLRREWNKTKQKNEVDIFKVLFEDDIEYEDMFLTIYSNEWDIALTKCLEYFELKEEYELCIKINELLTKIKNQ